MADAVRILKTDEETTFDDDGKIKAAVRVVFKVGEHGPFRKLFDKATFNASAARMEIDQFARDLDLLHRT